MNQEKKKSQITNIRAEIGGITSPKNVQTLMIVIKYYEQIYANKVNDIDGMD